MRVGLVIYGSLDTLSGGYLYDRMLVRELRAQGHEVSTFSLPWRSYPAHLTDNLAAGFAARIAAARLDILLQDELNHPSLFLLNLLLRRRLACPIICIVHHLRSQEAHSPVLLPLYRSVERAYLQTVDGCIYNSCTTQATVTALLQRTLPGMVAYPAADHIQPPAHPDLLEWLRRRAASRAPLQVLFVGNVVARKGLHTLVAALAALPAGQWTLSIVGSLSIDPAYVKHVQKLAARMGVQDHLTWHDKLDDSGLRHQLRSADLLAVPSYEGFGIVYLEAMAYGLPVLASTSGAAHEIVTDGRNGYLVQAGNAIALSQRLAQLAANRGHIAVLGYQARQQFDRHPTWRTSLSPVISWLHERIDR